MVYYKQAFIKCQKNKIIFSINPVKKMASFDDIPLMLPKLAISTHVIQRQEFIKFLGVLLDENLNWKERIKYTENRIVKKKLGLVYKARTFCR